VHRFLIAGLFLFHLFAKAFGLIFGVVELREAVGQLPPADEKLEPVGHLRIVVVAPRQRAHFGRICGDEGRLLQAMLDGFLEDLDLDFAQPPAVLHVDIHPLGDLAGGRGIGQRLGGDLRVEVQNGIEHAHAGKRLAQVVFEGFQHLPGLVAHGVDHAGGAQHLLRHAAQHLFGQVHQIVVIGIALIEFDHGELRVVAGGEPLVAEVAVDLKHPLEAPHHQPLEVELRGDAQVHLQVQRVMMGDERARRGATGDRVQHRRFHFDEAPLDQVVADTRDDSGAHLEHLARALVHDQIHVALAIAQLHVLQPLELVGQRAQVFGQQLVLRHIHIKVALAGLVQQAADADDVTQIHPLGKGARLLVDVQLDAPAHILQHHERAAIAHHPARHGDPDAGLFQLLLALAAMRPLQVVGVAVTAKVVGEGVALLAQGGKFFPPFGDQAVFILRLVLLHAVVCHRGYLETDTYRPALRLASIN